MTLNNKKQQKHKILSNLNKGITLNAIRKLQPVSVPDLVKETNISNPTVLNCINEFEDKNLIVNAGLGESTGGRPPKLYALNSEDNFLLGIELDFPIVKMIVIDLNGEVKSFNEFRVDTTETVEEILDSILDKAANYFNDKILAIGIGIIGFLDIKSGVSLNTPRITNWSDIAIKKVFEDKFGVPVYLNNQTDCYALAEMYFGNGSDNFAFLGFYRGVGCGLVIDGNIYSGIYGNAGVIGHTTIDKNGPECSCGKRGCLEVYSSNKAITEKVENAIKTGEGSVINSITEVTPENIFRAYKDDDLLCNMVVNEAIEYLGIALANFIMLFEMQQIIVGGTLLEGGEKALKYLEKETKSHLQPSFMSSNLNINFSKLDQDKAGALGATVPMLKEIFSLPEV